MKKAAVTGISIPHSAIVSFAASALVLTGVMIRPIGVRVNGPITESVPDSAVALVAFEFVLCCTQREAASQNEIST